MLKVLIDNLLSKSKVASDKERREYFRIKNWVILNHRAVEAIPDNDSGIDQESDAQIALLQQLSRLNEESQGYLSSLNQQGDLGLFLSNLNKKVALLTQFAIHSLNSDPKKLTIVDLSGGGLRFKSQENYATEQLIKIDLVLTPECVAIAAYAKVVDCQLVEAQAKDEEPAYEVAVSFIKLSENERDAIIKHVFAVQSKQLRDNKQSD